MKRTTSATELLLRIERRSRVPVRLQLERELRSAIQTGRLAAGHVLPATRALAGDLDLSRGVVVEAYEQLLAEGYLVAQRGSATRVAARRALVESSAPPQASAPPPRFDFRPGLPDLTLFPRRTWLSSMRRALSSATDEALDYPDARGAEPARRALASYVNRARATVADADRVVFCNGSAQGIGLVCRALRARGARRIAVEDPGHADQCTDIQSAGLETPRIAVDADGLRVDQLAASRADAVLVTPAHQYPTGVVLAPERRSALLEWAARRQAFIIEDDYDAEYRYDREPISALQGMAPDCVVYVGSASKVLSPALRLGWLVVPPVLLGEITRAKLQADRGSPAFEQLAFAELLSRGEFERHLRRTRQIYRQRRDLLVRELRERCPSVGVQGVAAGLHVLLQLAAGSDEEGIVGEAQEQSIRVYGARQYYAARDHGPAPALLIGYGALPGSRIPLAVKRLATVLEHSPLRATF